MLTSLCISFWNILLGAYLSGTFFWYIGSQAMDYVALSVHIFLEHSSGTSVPRLGTRLLSRFVLVCHDGVQPLLSLLYDGLFLVLERSFAFFQVADGYQCRKIRLIESNAKCNYPKKLTCKRTLRQVFLSVWCPLSSYDPMPPPLHSHCIPVYSILIHTGKGGEGGGRANQRQGYRGNSPQSQ
jgi:hypothetical protein